MSAPWTACPYRAIAEEVLTAKQLRVFRLRWQGMSIRQIAQYEHCSPSTVRDHQATAVLKIQRHPDYKEEPHATRP